MKPEYDLIKTKKTDIFKVKYDPLIVKVNAINAKDPD
jgi:hypothetical protein